MRPVRDRKADSSVCNNRSVGEDLKEERREKMGESGRLPKFAEERQELKNCGGKHRNLLSEVYEASLGGQLIGIEVKGRVRCLPPFVGAGAMLLLR